MKPYERSGIFFFILAVFLLGGILDSWASSPKPLPPKKHPALHPLGKPPKKALHKKPSKRRFVLAPHPAKPARPASGHVWIHRYRHPSGVYVGGYWRPPHKKGYTWVGGYWDNQGDWIFGYWKPLKLKKAHVWAPGFWDGSIWVAGFWRVEKKSGFVWVPGHFNSRGRWVKAHWKPL